MRSLDQRAVSPLLERVVRVNLFVIRWSSHFAGIITLAGRWILRDEIDSPQFTASRAMFAAVKVRTRPV